MSSRWLGECSMEGCSRVQGLSTLAGAVADVLRGERGCHEGIRLRFSRATASTCDFAHDVHSSESLAHP
eukprot:886621-Prorocentrum_minimum.AAC.2